MSSTRALKHVFSRIVADTVDYLPYNFRWEASNGTLAHAVNADLEPGQRCVSLDTRGRVLLLVGTRQGTVVIHEAHPASDNQPFQLVVETPETLQWILRNGPLTARTLERLVGADIRPTPTGSVPAISFRPSHAA